MKRTIYLIFSFVLLIAGSSQLNAQGTTNPYCVGGAATGICNQPGVSNASGNGINDFIDCFNTCGANQDIVNNNSGCNGQTNNYIYYQGVHTMIAAPGQYINCNLKSGITFAQGFAIFVDWNQNNIFDMPGERVAATSNAPPAATWTTIGFPIPSTQALGTYRLRVRTSFATGGTSILPCGQQTYSETEDYDLIIVQNNTSSAITGTASNNSPICGGQALVLNVAANPTTSAIQWSGPGNFTSTAVSPVRTNASPAMNGVYTVTLGSGGCPLILTTTVVVAPNSNFTITPTHTICQGGQFFAAATLTPGSNSTQFSFNWAPSAGAGLIFSPLAPSTSITPLLLPTTVSLSNVVYSITVSPTVMPSCSTMKTITVTINNPLTPSLTMPPVPLCNSYAQHTLTAAPGGGTWSAHTAVNPGGIFTPSLVTSFGTQTVAYSVAVGTCVVSNTGTFIVAKYNTPAFTSSLSLVCEQDQGHNLMNLVQNTVTGTWGGLVHNNAGVPFQAITNNIFDPSNLPSGVYTATYSTLSQSIAGVCNATNVLTIPLFNPPSPVISPIGARCSNAGTVALSASPTGGIWQNNSGVTISGIQTPSLNPIGTNNVTYVAGQGTCVASSTATFHVSRYNTAAITGSVPNLCETSNPVNLLSIVQNTNGAWNGVNVNSNNQFSPQGLPTNTFMLVYHNWSTPDSLLCDETASITVSVLKPEVPDISQVGPFCSKSGTVQLSVSPSTGAWTPFNYITANGVFTPSLAGVGNNAVQYVIGTSTCNAQQTKYINIEAFVPATLASTILPDQCNTNMPVNLSPITLNSAGTWSGTAIIGTNFNPMLSGAGTFILSHHTASYPSRLCPDQATVAVRVFSLAAPFIKEAGPFCDVSKPTQLVVSPVGGLFAGYNTTGISQSGLFNPAHAVPGENVISYSIASGPCIAYTQSTITVEKFVSAAFMFYPEPAYCKNSPAFNLNSLVVNPGGLWSGPGVTGSMFDPSKANAGNNNFIVYRTSSGQSPLLCPDVSSVQITIQDVPVVEVVSSKVKDCAPAEVNFKFVNSNTGSGEWNFGDGKSEAGLFPKHIYNTPGTYSVVFNYTAGACTAQARLSTPITISESPNADFEFSRQELSISDPEVELINTSTVLGNNKYVWTIQGQQYYEVNPRISFPKIGSYLVTLTATNSSGCTDEVTKRIEVKNEFNVFIPNSFTPNADGVNDYFLPVFSPFGLDTRTYEMEVYDRWGHVVFSTKDPAKGWDGSFQNKGDLPLKQENYVYRIKFKDMDGKIYLKNGYVTILNQ